MLGWRSVAELLYQRHDEEPDAPHRHIYFRAQRRRRATDQSVVRLAFVVRGDVRFPASDKAARTRAKVEKPGLTGGGPQPSAPTGRGTAMARNNTSQKPQSES